MFQKLSGALVFTKGEPGGRELIIQELVLDSCFVYG